MRRCMCWKTNALRNCRIILEWEKRDFLENLSVIPKNFDLRQRKMKEKALDQESSFSCYCQ